MVGRTDAAGAGGRLQDQAFHAVDRRLAAHLALGFEPLFQGAEGVVVGHDIVGDDHVVAGIGPHPGDEVLHTRIVTGGDQGHRHPHILPAAGAECAQVGFGKAQEGHGHIF